MRKSQVKIALISLIVTVVTMLSVTFAWMSTKDWYTNYAAEYDKEFIIATDEVEIVASYQLNDGEICQYSSDFSLSRFKPGDILRFYFSITNQYSSSSLINIYLSDILYSQALGNSLYLGTITPTAQVSLINDIVTYNGESYFCSIFKDLVIPAHETIECNWYITLDRLAGNATSLTEFSFRKVFIKN